MSKDKLTKKEAKKKKKEKVFSVDKAQKTIKKQKRSRADIMKNLFGDE